MCRRLPRRRPRYRPPMRCRSRSRASWSAVRIRRQQREPAIAKASITWRTATGERAAHSGWRGRPAGGSRDGRPPLHRSATIGRPSVRYRSRSGHSMSCVTMITVCPCACSSSRIRSVSRPVSLSRLRRLVRQDHRAAVMIARAMATRCCSRRRAGWKAVAVVAKPSASATPLRALAAWGRDAGVDGRHFDVLPAATGWAAVRCTPTGSMSAPTGRSSVPAIAPRRDWLAACARLIQAAQDVHQRRLARTGRTDGWQP